MSRHEWTADDERRIGVVWFSYGSNAWRRRTGRAQWKSEVVATDEQVWLLNGRRRQR